MSSIARLKIAFSNLSAADLESKLALDTGAPGMSVRRVSDILRQIAGYSKAATVEVGTGMAHASGTITMTDVATNGQTCKIAGQTVTAATSGNGTTSFTIGAGEEAQGDNLAALINANTTINKIFSATSDGLGVVTVTALASGKVGNGLWFAYVNLSNATFSALTGGDESLTTLSLV